MTKILGEKDYEAQKTSDEEVQIMRRRPIITSIDKSIRKSETSTIIVIKCFYRMLIIKVLNRRGESDEYGKRSKI